jgi:alpha-beta hydrolase superfamily lysophospholipase
MNSLAGSVRTRDGLTLRLRHWPAVDPLANRGTVCIVHGLGEHIDRYNHLAMSLSECGWSVVGYDQRGHGHSSGKRGVIHEQDDLLHDLASVVDTMQPLGGHQKRVLLGHSLGGLVVARFVSALSEPNENSGWQRPVDLCILSSPALALHLSLSQRFLLKTLAKILPNLALGNGLNPEWLCTDTEVVNRYRNDPLVHDRISGRLASFMLEAIEVVVNRAPSWATPTLLLYSGIDRCVNPIGSESFTLSTKPEMVETRIYEKLRHEIFNEPSTAGVYSELKSWLDKVVSK